MRPIEIPKDEIKIGLAGQGKLHKLRAKHSFDYAHKRINQKNHLSKRGIITAKITKKFASVTERLPKVLLKVTAMAE